MEGTLLPNSINEIDIPVLAPQLQTQMSSPPTSPMGSRSGSRSPTAIRRHKLAVPPGFRASPRPKQRPITEMSVRELQDLWHKNARVLSSSAASTSTYVHRITAEQAAIESQLVEVHGMDVINTGLKNTRIIGEDEIDVDPTPEPPMSRAIDAKRRAIAQFGATAGPTAIGTLDLQEAIDIERRAHAHDLERQQRIEAKRQHHGYPMQGEVMTKAEREARIWAFINHKPTDSDLEDDDEDDDDDIANWFEDDQDDGRKGQDIVEPDTEDLDSLSNIIRVVDPDKMHYSTFYEPRDNGH